MILSMRSQSGSCQLGKTEGTVSSFFHFKRYMHVDDGSRFRRPPPAVFIRALKVVPTEKVVEVDWFREEYALGWQKYPYNFIVEELRVDGDHFSIFTPSYVSCYL